MSKVSALCVTNVISISASAGTMQNERIKTMVSKKKLASMNEGCYINRPRLEFYHPNAKGTGCAMAMALHPADYTKNGFISVSIANQMTVGNPTGDDPTYPTFDWENSVDVVLDFNDLCVILQVLRGETESICSGHGIFHKCKECCQRIQLCHLIDPVCGYSFEVFEKQANGGEEKRVYILLSPAESLGLYEAIHGSMYLIAFGRPSLAID